MIQKMTSGAVAKTILNVSLPILIGQLLQQLYNIADTIIVGQFLGVDALAAVGATWSLTYIVCYFCIGTCTGISVPLSQAYGADDMHLMRCYFVNGIYFVLIMGGILTVFTSLCSLQFLTWLGTPGNIIGDANVYLRINFIGLPFTILYNFCFGVLMAFGDSRKSSVFMALSTVLNMVLDVVMIVCWHWGVAGAAVSTILSQGIAGCFSLIYILKKYKILYPKGDEKRFRIVHIKKIISMSVPMGLQYSVTAIGALILQFSVNQLGSDAVAAYSTGSKVKGFFLCPLNALGTALSSFVGQNFGAGKYLRIREAMKKVMLMGFLYCGIIILVAILARGLIAGLFVASDEVVVHDYVKQFILYISIFQLELTVLFSARYCVQGMGYGKFSILSGMAEMLGRSLTAIFLVPLLGFSAVCWSEGITFLAGIVVIVPVYLYLIKHLMRKDIK